MSTGQLVESACRTWHCPDCGPRRARRWGRALDVYGYERWLTLTRPPSDLRQGMARLRHCLAATSPVEWCWSAERSEGGHEHVHAVVRGWIDHRRDGGRSVLDRACAAAGWGTVSWLERTPDNGSCGAYAAKCAGYAAKGSRGQYGEWLALNGGKRPWHWSRRYLGAPARAWLATVLPSTDPGPWVPCSAPDHHRREFPETGELQAVERSE